MCCPSQRESGGGQALHNSRGRDRRQLDRRHHLERVLGRRRQPDSLRAGLRLHREAHSVPGLVLIILNPVSRPNRARPSHSAN